MRGFSVFRLLVSMLLLCSLNFNIIAEEQVITVPSLEIGMVSFSNGLFSCNVSSESSFESNSCIMAEICNETGVIKDTLYYPFISSQTLEFSNVEYSDYVKVSVINSNHTHLSATAILHFNVFYVNEWMDLANALSGLMNCYRDNIECTTDSIDYASGRIIVKANGFLPDISNFHPDVIIIDNEDHYYIQFTTSFEAKGCTEYLTQFSNIVYAEPDSPISING